MSEIGDPVYVSERDYAGEVVETRTNDDGSTDCLVRYSIPGARRPFYETWWPQGCLAEPQEGPPMPDQVGDPPAPTPSPTPTPTPSPKKKPTDQ